jgi:hypothetical protein
MHFFSENITQNKRGYVVHSSRDAISQIFNVLNLCSINLWLNVPLMQSSLRELNLGYWGPDLGILVRVPHRNFETYSWIIYNCTIWMSICVNTAHALKKNANIKTWTRIFELHINASLLPYQLACHWIWMSKRRKVFTILLPWNVITSWKSH